MTFPILFPQYAKSSMDSSTKIPRKIKTVSRVMQKSNTTGTFHYISNSVFKRNSHLLLEELLSNTQLNFLYFRAELLLQFLLSGISPVLTLITTVQLISFDIIPHCSTLLYSLIEKCYAPAYKGDTKDDTSKLSIVLHRDRSVSASESR